MEKFSKRLLLPFAVFLGLLFLLMISTVIVFKYQTRNMVHPATKKITENVFIINNKNVSVYVIKKDERYIMVDAGFDIPALKNEFKRIGISPEKIEAVFLTHSDHDHADALSLFNYAKVYLSKDEIVLLNGKMNRMFMVRNKIEVPFETLKDGQELMTGGIKIRCLSTPGHTPGSMSYVIEDKYLFTGDTLMLDKGRVKPFNNFINMDTAREIRSIENLSHLNGIQYIFTAHYGLSNNFNQAFAR